MRRSKEERETGKTSDWSRKECDKVALPYSRVPCALGKEILVLGIALQLLAMIGFCEWVVLDILLVCRTKS